MKANGQLIETLKQSRIYQDCESAYREATGLPMALQSVETLQLPPHGKRKESSWCALMSEQRRTCAACLRMQESLTKAATNKACTMLCVYGLCETAVPIKLGSETIGFLQTGQIMGRKPTETSFQRALGEVARLGVNIDKKRAHMAYFSIPVVPRKKLESASHLLSIFADYISVKSNQIAVQSAKSDPPVIAEAKRFIEEHHSEGLSLGQVAQAVHTSIFYFCKLFKKVVGITFTEYVSRVRIERAKNLLLYPNRHVRDIAFEVGFQSLTHFNRVFRKLAGESPSEYRSHLRAAA